MQTTEILFICAWAMPLAKKDLQKVHNLAKTTVICQSTSSYYWKICCEKCGQHIISLCQWQTFHCLWPQKLNKVWGKTLVTGEHFSIYVWGVAQCHKLKRGRQTRKGRICCIRNFWKMRCGVIRPLTATVCTVAEYLASSPAFPICERQGRHLREDKVTSALANLRIYKNIQKFNSSF